MDIKYLVKYTGLIIIFLLFFSIGKSFNNLRNAEKRLKNAEEKVNKLKEEKQKLLENNNIRKAEGYLEKQIRNKLKLVKENETMVILPKELEEKSKEKVIYYEIEKNKLDNKKKIYEKWLELVL